jgi:hypothetical protein
MPHFFTSFKKICQHDADYHTFDDESGMVWLKNRFYGQIHGLSIQEKVYKIYLELAAAQK